MLAVVTIPNCEAIACCIGQKTGSHLQTWLSKTLWSNQIMLYQLVTQCTTGAHLIISHCHKVLISFIVISLWLLLWVSKLWGNYKCRCWLMRTWHMSVCVNILAQYPWLHGATCMAGQSPGNYVHCSTYVYMCIAALMSYWLINHTHSYVWPKQLTTW